MTSQNPQWMQPTAQYSAQQPPKKRPVPLILGVLLAVALLCCGGAGVLGKLVSDSKSSQSPAGLSAPIVYPSSPATTTPTTAPPSTAAPTTKPTAQPTAKPTTKPAAKRPVAPPTTKAPTKAPTSKPKPTTAPPPHVVHPGAFCAPAGATGVTSKGTPMICGPASDGRNRWKHA